MNICLQVRQALPNRPNANLNPQGQYSLPGTSHCQKCTYILNLFIVDVTRQFKGLDPVEKVTGDSSLVSLTHTFFFPKHPATCPKTLLWELRKLYKQNTPESGVPQQGVVRVIPPPLMQVPSKEREGSYSTILSDPLLAQQSSVNLWCVLFERLSGTPGKRLRKMKAVKD